MIQIDIDELFEQFASKIASKSTKAKHAEHSNLRVLLFFLVMLIGAGQLVNAIRGNVPDHLRTGVILFWLIVFSVVLYNFNRKIKAAEAAEAAQADKAAEAAEAARFAKSKFLELLADSNQSTLEEAKDFLDQLLDHRFSRRYLAGGVLFTLSLRECQVVIVDGRSFVNLDFTDIRNMRIVEGSSGPMLDLYLEDDETPILKVPFSDRVKAGEVELLIRSRTKSGLVQAVEAAESEIVALRSEVEHARAEAAGAREK